jgi:hypothetical protein
MPRVGVVAEVILPNISSESWSATKTAMENCQPMNWESVVLVCLTELM